MFFRHTLASDDDLKVAMEELWALRTEAAAAERAAQAASDGSPPPHLRSYAQNAVVLRLHHRQNRANR
jgi:hypothetical protein